MPRLACCWGCFEIVQKFWKLCDNRHSFLRTVTNIHDLFLCCQSLKSVVVFLSFARITLTSQSGRWMTPSSPGPPVYHGAWFVVGLLLAVQISCTLWREDSPAGHILPSSRLDYIQLVRMSDSFPWTCGRSVGCDQFLDAGWWSWPAAIVQRRDKRPLWISVALLPLQGLSSHWSWHCTPAVLLLFQTWQAGQLNQLSQQMISMWINIPETTENMKTTSEQLFALLYFKLNN